MPARKNTLICTVGTSLKYPNLAALAPEESDPKRNALYRAYAARDFAEVAAALHAFDATERTCGAEINSLAHLLNRENIDKVNLHLLYSDTDDGLEIAEILRHYFDSDGWGSVKIERVEDLNDKDPRAFRTWGLRNLVKVVGRLVREAGGSQLCAIDATGGYKAQVAIAVLLGQAIDIPVYYKHERFDDIISFPPMPVSLDASLWAQASAMFWDLSESTEPLLYESYSEDWDERLEALVERVPIDGQDYLELSAMGQIFHDAVSQQPRWSDQGRLPPAAGPGEKREPAFGGDHGSAYRREVRRFMQNVIDEVSYVRTCSTTYFNPDLSSRTLFRKESHDIEGVYSNGTYCWKFAVRTTAGDEHELEDIVADLNRRRPDFGG